MTRLEAVEKAIQEIEEVDPENKFTHQRKLGRARVLLLEMYRQIQSGNERQKKYRKNKRRKK